MVSPPCWGTSYRISLQWGTWVAVFGCTVAFGTSPCEGARGGSSYMGALPCALRRALFVSEGHVGHDGPTSCIWGYA